PAHRRCRVLLRCPPGECIDEALREAGAPRQEEVSRVPERHPHRRPQVRLLHITCCCVTGIKGEKPRPLSTGAELHPAERLIASSGSRRPCSSRNRNMRLP